MFKLRSTKSIVIRMCVGLGVWAVSYVAFSAVEREMRTLDRSMDELHSLIGGLKFAGAKAV
jgi:hypothetical protein